MVNTRKLIGLIAENELRRSDVAKALNISEFTLRKKLESGKFNSDEMYILYQLLHMEDPVSVFFASEGA